MKSKSKLTCLLGFCVLITVLFLGCDNPANSGVGADTNNPNQPSGEGSVPDDTTGEGSIPDDTTGEGSPSDESTETLTPTGPIVGTIQGVKTLFMDNFIPTTPEPELSINASINGDVSLYISNIQSFQILYYLDDTGIQKPLYFNMNNGDKSLLAVNDITKISNEIVGIKYDQVYKISINEAGQVFIVSTVYKEDGNGFWGSTALVNLRKKHLQMIKNKTLKTKKDPILQIKNMNYLRQI